MHTKNLLANIKKETLFVCIIELELNTCYRIKTSLIKKNSALSLLNYTINKLCLVNTNLVYFYFIENIIILLKLKKKLIY